MIIGVPKEIKAQEHRVAMVPGSVKDLVARGHRVLVERGAGAGASYPDEEFVAAGAEIAPGAEDVFVGAEFIVKVKDPQPEEVARLQPHHLLFSYLHLAADRRLTESLLASGCTALAYETLTVDGRLPLLEPMSEIAGRMAAMVGAYHLAIHRGGRGILLGGVPGVAPGRVVVVGGGTAGTNAAKVAAGIGADVTILEVDFERMRRLEDMDIDHTHTLYSTVPNLEDLLPRTDLIIGAVLVPGAAAPKLITRQMLGLMPAGSVLVDIAIDQGGCAETSRPTTHQDPTYTEEGVLHYCVSNMPGAYARTATQALNNVTASWVADLADHGLAAAAARRPDLLSAINTSAGKLTCAPVGAAHQIASEDAAAVMGTAAPGSPD
ncbi:alanine dehydrogenase [soil metagenome]